MNSAISTWNTTAESWWYWIVSAGWQSAVVGLLLLCAVAVARRWSSPVRYGLLLVALLKFAMPPLWSLPTGLLTHAVPAQSTVTGEFSDERLVESDGDASSATAWTGDSLIPATIEQSSDTPMAFEFGDDVTIVEAEFSNFANTIPPVATMEFGSSESAPQRIMPTWQAWLLLLHLTGTLIVAFLIAKQLRWLRRLLRDSQPVDDRIQQLFLNLKPTIGVGCNVRVLQSPAADSPIAFGILHPTILLPSTVDDFSESDLNTVLAHELAHLRQRDAWTNWLQLLLLAVWWFHPVYWVLQRNLRRVREECCDDLLIASGLTRADAYCDTLLRVARRSSTSRIQIACGMADGLHPMASRLKRILDPRVHRAVRLSLLHASLVAVIAFVLLPGLRSQLTEAQEPTAATENDVAQQEPFHVPEGLPIAKPKVDPYPGYLDTAVRFAPLQVKGRCLDSDGKPVSGANVMLLLNGFSGLHFADENGQRQHIDAKVAELASDADGHFEFNIDRYPVLDFKPTPVQKPAEATFGLMATADNYAIAWRSPRTLRFGERPETLDPEEADRLFFEGDPIELDLIFQPEVRLHGVVSDDLGEPLAGATVMLGLVTNSRSLPGQGPRSYKYTLIDPENKTDASPGWGLRELPETYRQVKTDDQGRYEIRGMPRNTSALLCVDYQRSYPMFGGSVKSAEGESTRSTYYVGTDGKFDVTLRRPRSITVALSSGDGTPPQCVVRAEPTGRAYTSILRDGAMATSVDGKATLQLPPGKFKLFIEPLPGQRLVKSSHDIEVQEQPVEQTMKFNVPAGAELVIRAVLKGTEIPVEDVAFGVMSNESPTPVDLQSQTVYLDYPRTGIDGTLTAVVHPGEFRILPIRLPQGFTPVAANSDLLKLTPGSSTPLTFEFERSAAAERLPTNPTLAALHKKWKRENQLIRRGSFTYRTNNFLRGEITPSELDEVFGLLEEKSLPEAEAILKHVFPRLTLANANYMLVNGDKRAVAITRSELRFPWNGRSISSLNVANGHEAFRYSGDNAQLDLYDAQKSPIGFSRLSDLITVPSLFQLLRNDVQVEELGDRIQIVATGAILVVDRKTGFVHEMNSMRPDGSGRTVQQFGPISHPNGAVTPTLRIEASFRNHTLDRAQVVFLDEADFEVEFPANAFSFAPPAGTNLLDYRDVDRQQVGSRPRAKVTMGPVSDVVAKANSARPSAQPTQAASGTNAGTVKTPTMKKLRLGDKAPEFSVAAWYDQNGKTSAPDLKGKAVIINFHRNYDHNSEENRELRQALKIFDGQAVEIVSIFSHRTDAEKAVAYMKKFQLPWKFAIDTPAEGTRYPYDATFTAFHLRGPTTTVVIDSSGAVYSAESHNNQIRDAIQAVVRVSGIKE